MISGGYVCIHLSILVYKQVMGTQSSYSARDDPCAYLFLRRLPFKTI